MKNFFQRWKDAFTWKVYLNLWESFDFLEVFEIVDNVFGCLIDIKTCNLRVSVIEQDCLIQVNTLLQIWTTNSYPQRESIFTVHAEKHLEIYANEDDSY